MQWEFDHVVLAPADGAETEASLTEFGMAFTVRRVHHGQRTANGRERHE
jgi:hypothetical protein